MPILFIHCGAPKTGTSFLQVLFARYAAALADAGIVYPETSSHAAASAGEITSGNGVEMANFLDPTLPHEIVDKEAFPDELRRIAKAANGCHLLYSSEFISFVDTERSARLVATITEIGYTPRIVYCVRDIGRAAISTYSQQVKRHGESRSFRDFLAGWDPYYEWNLQCKIRNFGQDNVRIYNYEEHRGRLAELFFRDILELDFVPYETERINRSLTLKELELMRTLNGHFPVPHREGLSTFVSDALMKISYKDQNIPLSTDEFELRESRFSQTVDFINNHIRGQPIQICDRIESRSAALVDDFELGVMAILARLMSVTLIR